MRLADRIYNLPDVYFVAGSTRQDTFTLKTKEGSEPLDILGGSVVYSISHYVNPEDNAILTKQAEIDHDELGYYCIAKVSLTEDDTKDLCGKYVYQLTISDGEGGVDSNYQGLMVIAKNNNPTSL